jgi:small subunit ribosomal protein S16
MVRIRLRRMGSKKQPTYRIVVCDKERSRDGAFIEVIGRYNPRTQPETVLVNEERAWHWLNVGAQPSDAVKQLFGKTGTLARFERLKKGEALETLKAEAQSWAEAAAAISPRTRIGIKPAPKPKKAQPAEVTPE